jgi:hypothetical protein
LFDDLRSAVARNKELSQVRDRWLREYAKQDVRTLTLTRAWQNREFALAEGAGDSPSQINEWVAQYGFKKYVEGLRIQGRENLPSSEDIDNRQGLISALSKYPMHKALDAFGRFVTDEQEAKLRHADLAPGKVEIEVDGESFVVEVLPKTDPRGFTLGIDTGCCMTLGGASESCIWAGYEDPRYGFIAISKEGRLRAQSLLYTNGESSDGVVDSSVLVLDNIEANQGSDISKLMQVYQAALQRLLSEGALNRSIKQVNLGEGNTDVDFSNLEIVNPVSTPLEDVYSDAARQRLLLRVD